jgi:hypothetical protein
MTRDEVFAAWAPKGSVWTPWVKPVLFSYADDVEPREVAIEQPSWVADIAALEEESAKEHPHRSSARTRDVAVVIDLPGATSVRSGVALLRENFFPVPLFNALPHSMGVVPMMPVIDAIVSGTAARARASLSRDANPAFLLDSRRRGEGVQLLPGRFDNRSMPFVTDFPSAATLMKANVRRAVLVHEGAPATDLIGMLFEWQRAGIMIYSKPIDETGLPQAITLRSPSLLRRISQWWTRQGMRPKNGTFGALITPGGG